MYPFFAILAGFAGPHMQNLPIPVRGKTEMSDWMSFMATCLGYAITWGPFSADYSVYMRENTGSKRLFCWTYFSLVSCQILIMALGASLATTIPGSDAFQTAFETAGVGGLMDESFKGHGSGAYGFGKFVQLVLVLSTIAVTIPDLYSLGLSMQNVGMWAAKVPRFIWTSIGFVVSTVSAIAGRDHFATILENFLNCLAYWYLSRGVTQLTSGSLRGLRLSAWKTGGSDMVEGILINSISGGLKKGYLGGSLQRQPVLAALFLQSCL